PAGSLPTAPAHYQGARHHPTALWPRQCPRPYLLAQSWVLPWPTRPCELRARAFGRPWQLFGFAGTGGATTHAVLRPRGTEALAAYRAHPESSLTLSYTTLEIQGIKRRSSITLALGMGKPGAHWYRCSAARKWSTVEERRSRASAE